MFISERCTAHSDSRKGHTKQNNSQQKRAREDIECATFRTN